MMAMFDGALPWLFHHAADFPNAVGDRLGIRIDDAVALGLVHRHAESGDHRRVVLGGHVDHLLGRGHLGVDHVVAQQHGKGLVADEVTRRQNRMAQAQRLFLADGMHLDRATDFTDRLQALEIALFLQKRLQTVVDIEVILDRALAAGGDKDDLADAAAPGLLDDVMDRRTIDDGKQLFGHHFRGG